VLSLALEVMPAPSSCAQLAMRLRADATGHGRPDEVLSPWLGDALVQIHRCQLGFESAVKHTLIATKKFLTS